MRAKRQTFRPFSALAVLGGAGAGAALMYFLDPTGGRRRRALLHNQTERVRSEGREFARKARKDAANRAQGLAYEARSGAHADQVPDNILEERVRSAMGRLVSHPGAIHVSANEGVVTLSGDILDDEARGLLSRLRHMPAVRGIQNRLEHHKHPGRVSSLQGSGKLQIRSQQQTEAWKPAGRLIATAAGSGLTLLGLTWKGVPRVIATAAGAGLLVRGLTNRPFRHALGATPERRVIDIRKSINIEAPIERVFAFFSDFENFPRFMSHVRSVERRADRYHWEVEGPAGSTFQWDAEVTDHKPNRRIAWRSVRGSLVPNQGAVRFRQQGPDRTRIDVQLSYNPPGGAVGHAIASLFGADPKTAMDDDFLRLKSLLESGRATAHGRTAESQQYAPD